MKHVLVINRYDDELSDYRKYIDHNQNDVSYISLSGRTSLLDPVASKFIVEVDRLTIDVVIDEARRIHHQQPIDCVIAFSEYDLDAAAIIRSELDIQGSKIVDNLLFRNKASMKAALVNSGVRYPRYRNISSYAEIENFCLEYGYPVIVKPQVGAASEGVIKIEDSEQIPCLDNLFNYEVEEYIDGNIYHVDAILAVNGMPYFKVSKYINTCLNFRLGEPLGSVTVDDSAFIERARAFTCTVCSCLKLKNQAIHLEFIENRGELVFLEVGGRVGGGEIPFVAMRSEGIDLYALWSQAALGMSIFPVKTCITGFLMMPNPFSSGYHFDPNMTLTHPLLTYSEIQASSTTNEFSYEDIPAKLHFMGQTQASVEDAISTCMNILQESIQPLY